MTDFYDERAEHLHADADRYDEPRWIGTHRHHPDEVPDERDEYDDGYSWQLTPQQSADLTAQLVAVELLGGSRTFTVANVSKGNAEQPVNVHLVEFPRPWRPGKSMRRVLAACWGTDASQWVGRRVELYCDETIRFGSETVGGTRIRALSHIDKPKSVPLLVSRGKSATFKVQPLPELTPAERIAALRAEWKNADPERRKVIESEVSALSTPDDDVSANDPTLDEVP